MRSRIVIASFTGQADARSLIERRVQRQRKVEFTHLFDHPHALVPRYGTQEGSEGGRLACAGRSGEQCRATDLGQAPQERGSGW